MWIKEVVRNLISKHGTNNPFEIAEAKKIHVYEWNLNQEIFGFYRYIRRNKFIYINSNLKSVDKHFTCAHELGHSDLHPMLNTPALKRKTLFSIDKIEMQANRFAVELLLPDNCLDEYRYSNLSIEQIADIHGVPKELARLKKYECFS